MGNPDDRFSREMEQEAATVKIAHSVAYIFSGFGVTNCLKRPFKKKTKKKNTCL